MALFGCPTAVILDAAAQAAGTVERGPGVQLIPVAAGLLFALAIVAFFMRFAAKKGELDRKYDKHKFDKKR